MALSLNYAKDSEYKRKKRHRFGTSSPGEGVQYKKDEGSPQKFTEGHLTGTKILFCGLGLQIIFPPTDTIYYKTHYTLSHDIFFQFNALIGTAENLAVELNPIRSSKTTI